MERVEITEGRTHNHHIKRYEFASKFLAGKTVCSLACGTGYGEQHMAVHGNPKKIVGIDLSNDAVNYARAHHSHPLVIFEQSDKFSAGHPAESFDVFVTLETIEHIENDRDFLAEIKRVLKPGGLVILSTPNRARSWSDLFASKPHNQFHVREYMKSELEAMIGEYFKEIRFYGQRRILRRSVPAFWRYLFCRLSGRLKRNEVDNFDVVEYPKDHKYDLTYFLVTCRK